MNFNLTTNWYKLFNLDDIPGMTNYNLIRKAALFMTYVYS